MKKITPLQLKTIQWLIYISFIAGMISQINHTIIVYQRLANHDSILYALCFVISFDLFIGIAIMIGWKLPALLASIIMVGINLLCYNVFNIISNEGISSILISLIQPGMI